MVLRMTMTQGKPEIPEDLIAKWQRDVQYVPIRLRQTPTTYRIAAHVLFTAAISHEETLATSGVIQLG